MTHMIDECRRQGYHALIACITADNLSSLRFHQRLGFRQVSRFLEVGRKFDRWLDVIDLELSLKTAGLRNIFVSWKKLGYF